MNTKQFIYRNYLLITTVALSMNFPPVPVQARQDNISISGKVTAADDQAPVPHVNISVDRKGIATATNSAGRFILLVPPANLTDTLKISCIGFTTKYLPIAGLREETLSISLEKSITELNEINLAYYDAVKIIQKAITRITENYISHPHILRGFYRMYTAADMVPLQLSEAVFDVYNFGYGDQHADQFKLIKARNERNERDFAAVELGQKPNSVFEDDLINHRYSSGFLSDAGLKKHQFKVTSVVDFRGYQAYEIDFKEEHEAEETFRGHLYIDTKTFAFIYFDFGLSPSGLADAGMGNFISHALMKVGDVEISLKQDRTRVSYQEVGHKWVLSNVEGDHLLAIRSTAGTDNLTANVKFNYQVTAVDTVAKSSFGAGSKLGRSENINNQDSKEDPKFWKDYNIVLSDFEAGDVFKKLETINKQLKEKKEQR